MKRETPSTKIYSRAFCPLLDISGESLAQRKGWTAANGTRASSGCSLFQQEEAMDKLIRKRTPDRSKINMLSYYEVKYWSRELGISKEQLQEVVDKDSENQRLRSERNWLLHHIDPLRRRPASIHHYLQSDLRHNCTRSGCAEREAICAAR
jgi:hypothetical protein